MQKDAPEEKLKHTISNSTKISEECCVKILQSGIYTIHHDEGGIVRKISLSGDRSEIPSRLDVRGPHISGFATDRCVNMFDAMDGSLIISDETTMVATCKDNKMQSSAKLVGPSGRPPVFKKAEYWQNMIWLDTLGCLIMLSGWVDDPPFQDAFILMRKIKLNGLTTPIPRLSDKKFNSCHTPFLFEHRKKMFVVYDPKAYGNEERSTTVHVYDLTDEKRKRPPTTTEIKDAHSMVMTSDGKFVCRNVDQISLIDLDSRAVITFREKVDVLCEIATYDNEIVTVNNSTPPSPVANFTDIRAGCVIQTVRIPSEHQCRTLGYHAGRLVAATCDTICLFD